MRMAAAGSIFFEVERAGRQFRMHLGKEVGPVFTDDAPPPDGTEHRLRIDFAPEGKSDGVVLDNVALELPKA